MPITLQVLMFPPYFFGIFSEHLHDFWQQFLQNIIDADK